MALTYDEFRSYLAEGFHTAFRKAGESRNAGRIWEGIRELDGDEWGRIVAFVAEPTWEALGREVPPP